MLLSYQLYGNSGKNYLIALIIFIITLVLLKLVQKTIISRLEKLAMRTKTKVDDALIEIIANIKPSFYFLVSLYFSIKVINLSTKVTRVIDIVFLIILVYEGIKATQRIIKFFIFRALKKNGDEKQAKSITHTFDIFIQITLWSLGILLILANMGINVTSLVAGLGIGGIAIALALQNILGDVFSSFSILIDKPFKVGDFIKVGEDMGTVENIGIKTSRIRTLDGQILIITNQELTTARVENFQQTKKKRAIFTLGVIYETKKEILKKIPKIISDIVSQEENCQFDRCHFKGFGDFSLNFEVVFYVNTKDYNQYLDALQKVNLKIFDKFNQEQISFAYPTQLLYQKNI